MVGSCTAFRGLVAIFVLSLAGLPAAAAPAEDPKPEGPARPAAAPVEESPKPFADVIKDAQVLPGLFTLYRKEEKVYMEVLPGQLDRVFLHMSTLESGLGGRGFFSALPLEDFVFVFRRVGKNIQLVRKNMHYTADARAPIQKAVRRSYGDSILGSARIESTPHPERKSVLVDLGNLFLVDLPMMGFALESEYHWPYKLDIATSSLGAV